MRIAIASSGLGHVARGIETWARDTADALHRRGVMDQSVYDGDTVLMDPLSSTIPHSPLS